MDMSFLDSASILVTGGTGSFGQRFIKKLLAESSARRIIIFSRDELKQSEMKRLIPDPEQRLRFFLGDVRDADRLNMAFRGVDYVVHAAALKQVPALEYNPFEAVKTNVLGTQNVISAAIGSDVKKVVLVSTDKAANPANLYGATKLCAERLMVSANFYAANKKAFSIVRYGNVVGSRGSLGHVVQDQIATGTVSLTHPDMTRFWITLDRGVDLVLHALSEMHGGETFIPKAPSMHVKDFLRVIAPSCKVTIIGIRPGEKMHEVLVTPEEGRRSVEVGDHYVILPDFGEWPHTAAYNKKGKKLPENFVFASNTNTEWLDEDGLKKLLESV